MKTIHWNHIKFCATIQTEVAKPHPLHPLISIAVFMCRWCHKLPDDVNDGRACCLWTNPILKLNFHTPTFALSLALLQVSKKDGPLFGHSAREAQSNSSKRLRLSLRVNTSLSWRKASRSRRFNSLYGTRRRSNSGRAKKSCKDSRHPSLVLAGGDPGNRCGKVLF